MRRVSRRDSDKVNRWNRSVRGPGVSLRGRRRRLAPAWPVRPPQYYAMPAMATCVGTRPRRHTALQLQQLGIMACIRSMAMR